MKEKEHYKSFHIRGFGYYDGALIFEKIKTIGTVLELKVEPNNIHDENAVAIYYKESKLGYVPTEKNYSISKLLKMGHNPFYVVVQQSNAKANPSDQIRVIIYVVKKD